MLVVLIQFLTLQGTRTSATKYLIVSLVYFSDSTWQKSSLYAGAPPVFAKHTANKWLTKFHESILHITITYRIPVGKHAKISWERRFARLAGGFGRMVRSP